MTGSLFVLSSLFLLFSAQSDVSSFELFAFASVSSDPLQVRRRRKIVFPKVLSLADHHHIEDIAGEQKITWHPD